MSYGVFLTDRQTEDIIIRVVRFPLIINKTQMERDRKENRRHSYKQKSFKKNRKDLDFDLKDKTKIKNAFKHKKKTLEEEESWEDWQDEIH